MYMLVLMVWYIRMNTITHGADYKNLKYKHERDYVWADFRALLFELEYDYAWGWNEIFEAEYVKGYYVNIIKISLGKFKCESDT